MAMSHVFISYSRKDSKTVDSIVQRLEAEDFAVWIDREEIHGGDLWREAIVEAVDNAYVFVLMLSPNSVASDNVRKEVDLADGAGKALLPMMLAQAQLTSRLRYQLAGIQWIEYYRDPDGKFNELISVLRVFEKKYGTVQSPATRQVEFVFNGLDLLKLSQEERKQLQEKLLEVIAKSTNTPRRDLNIVKMAAGSVHVFVDMPAHVAYKVKTAALNKDSSLIDGGIGALRLVGERNFVVLRAGNKPPPKSGKRGGSRWLFGGVALLVVLLLSAIVFTVVFSKEPFSSAVTSLITAIPQYIPNKPIQTNVPPSETPSPPETSTLTTTPTDTNTPSPEVTSMILITGETDTPTPTVTSVGLVMVTPDLYDPPNPSIVSPPYGTNFACLDKAVNLSWKPVDDPSGIKLYRIDLFVSYSSEQGPWSLLDEWDNAPTQTSSEIGIDCGAWYLWKITALDGAGNWGTSSTGQFSSIANQPPPVMPPTPTPTDTPLVDTEAPVVYSNYVDTNLVYYFSSISKSDCEPKTLTIGASVKDDPSGVTDIQLIYAFILKGTYMGDNSVSMTLISGDKYDGSYKVTIDIDKEAASFFDPDSGTILIQFSATDAVGNSMKTPVVTEVTVGTCQ
jgi:hypothetical protein